MGIKITGLNELRERLERLRPEEVMSRALAEQAARMAARVREGLSEPPGGAGHDKPWLRSGALQSSVGAQADGLQAVVGSNDPAAVPQELGTAHMPPRPFLAPVGAAMAGEVAETLGMAVSNALRGGVSDEHGAAEATEIDHGVEPTPVSASKGFVSRARKGGVVRVASADDPQGLKMAAAAARQAGLTTKEERREFHDAIKGKGITKSSVLLDIAKSIKERS